MSNERVQYTVDQRGDSVFLTLEKPGKKPKTYKLTSGQASNLAGSLMAGGFASAIMGAGK